ncbi:hypothetical protein K466DRAFT_607294 [Polyporus arcularius HHB13444]|uniref:Uncharacterized protein n=1 Tax=Polyporus arcularius HHB13444 TaxID=1314778 RepID=A0A5C3NX88_9APHY|nr:hypothetical protein K466DRAFT_607294 [Polyporus arcularius HHB13444]
MSSVSSVRVPSLTDGASSPSTTSVAFRTRSLPALVVYTYGYHFPSTSLPRKDPKTSTFASNELYYYLRVTRGQVHVNVPLGVGPTRPAARMATWKTILAHLHGTIVERLELPLPLWQALRDLLLVLVWFWEQRWLPVNEAWCKFEEVVTYSTTFDGGAPRDMSRWLLNLMAWLQDIVPAAAWVEPVLTWKDIQQAVQRVTHRPARRSVGIQCPDALMPTHSKARGDGVEEVDPGAEEPSDGFDSPLWQAQNPTQSFTLGVYHPERYVFHLLLEALTPSAPRYS